MGGSDRRFIIIIGGVAARQDKTDGAPTERCTACDYQYSLMHLLFSSLPCCLALPPVLFTSQPPLDTHSLLFSSLSCDLYTHFSSLHFSATKKLTPLLFPSLPPTQSLLFSSLLSGLDTLFSSLHFPATYRHRHSPSSLRSLIPICRHSLLFSSLPAT